MILRVLGIRKLMRGPDLLTLETEGLEFLEENM